MSIEIEKMTISNARPGIPNQVAKGIHGSFNIDIFQTGGTLFLSCKEMTLRQTRNGKWYGAPPFRIWEGKDGQKNRTHFYYFYGGSSDRDDRMKGILEKVLKELSINPDEMPQSAGQETGATEEPRQPLF